MLDDEIVRARSEGARYFGDGRLYVERYVERPRHIEVQVLGDAHGNVVHLFDRECSVQRRFQKIVEEAPSPALDEKSAGVSARSRSALRAPPAIATPARSSSSTARGDSYFLEMNTRLQVEHPVTEMVTGHRSRGRAVAGRGRRTASLHAIVDCSLDGHAIEYRIYAESPARGFIPTTGRIVKMSLPDEPGVRVDCGVSEGQSVTTAFDPMLAKLVVHGRDREAARSACPRRPRPACRTRLRDQHGLPAAADRRPGLCSGALCIPAFWTSIRRSLPSRQSVPIWRLKLIAAAALSLGAVRDSADAVPEIFSAMGAWRN